MNRHFLLPAFLFLLLSVVKAQIRPASLAAAQPFGKIDTADLKLTTCDFEKDANAEVLFDQAVVNYRFSTVITERHKRIKIFNDKGNAEANIRIEYLAHSDEKISDVEAETINLNNKTIEYSIIDPKLIYTEAVDKDTKAIVFTFPNIRSGSIIEFKYKKTTPYGYNYPDWFFQGDIPCRYSEFDASFIEDYHFSIFKKIYQTLVKDTAMVRTSPTGTRHIWAMSNINAYKQEPFMDYPEDYLQCVLTRIEHKSETWIKVADWMLYDDDMGKQLTKTIGNEQEIINKAKTLKTDGEKIAFIFDTVKRAMKWNKINRWYCIDGIKKAWDKKTGNSAEINLILYHFLTMANVETYLLAVRTRNHGKLDIEYPTLSQLNKIVVYCPVDSAKQYVLDASDKLNAYNNIPLNLIGLQALSMEVVSKKYTMFVIKTGKTREVTLINGSINAEGKLEGTTQISSTSYSRKKYLEQYNELGEKKYIDEIQKDNNSLKITSLKIENVENDTLPLVQSFEFKYNLTDPDGDYMYFNPNLFTGLGANPFSSEARVSNIDFGCLYNYSINGRYKIPPGYKADVLPKPSSMQLPDKAIIFKRFVAEQDGTIIIHYTIDYKRGAFTKEEYPAIRDFYKKMYEMLNEQIVLKKL
jgi:hypothetical protein